MSALAPALPRPASGLVAEAFRRQPVLAAAAFAFLLAAPVTYALQVVDARTLNGVSVWVKPAKFFLSVGVFYLTLAWFFAYGRPGYAQTLGGRWTVWAAVVAGLAEQVWVTTMAALGQASHFNVSTPFLTALYPAMGVLALILTSAAFTLGWEVARGGAELRPAYKWAVAIGLMLSFVLGSLAGSVMAPNGGHWVGGVPTDAGGAPLFGWSRTGGDLRVPHFVGLHAMHALPLVGWALGRVSPRWAGVVAVLAASAAYVGLFAWTLTEALAGRPFWPL